MKKHLEKIAKQHLAIDTLEVRNNDSLDFHDCGVGMLKRALEAAFKAGQEKERKRKRQIYWNQIASHGRKQT